MQCLFILCEALKELSKKKGDFMLKIFHYILFEMFFYFRNIYHV